MVEYRRNGSFVILFLLSSLLFSLQSTFPPIFGNPSPSIYFGRPTEITGSFFLANSTDKQALCGIVGAYPLIGETWNLTISVAKNSSSGVNVSYFGQYIYDMDWWEGADSFQVLPNHFHSEIYISHYTTDFPAFPGFFIALHDTAGNSSGTFQLSMIFRGYAIDYPKPGSDYVSNITEWLIFLSSPE